MTTFDQPTIDFPSAPSVPDGYHYEQGRCPNVGRACNCPGYCRPRIVKDELPSAPIDGDTRAVVETVANNARDDDWNRFKAKCIVAQSIRGEVSPDKVRDLFTRDGELTINPRVLSAFYNRATGKNGFLDFSHWGINTDTKGRNAGRPARIYKLRSNV